MTLDNEGTVSVANMTTYLESTSRNYTRFYFTKQLHILSVELETLSEMCHLGQERHNWQKYISHHGNNLSLYKIYFFATKNCIGAFLMPSMLCYLFCHLCHCYHKWQNSDNVRNSTDKSAITLKTEI